MNNQNAIPGSLTPNRCQPSKSINNIGWAAIMSDPTDLFRLGRCENFSIRSIEATRNGARWFDYGHDHNRTYSHPPQCTFVELTHADGRGWVLSLQLDTKFELYFTLFQCRTKTNGAHYKEATNQQSMAFDKLIQRHRAAWQTAENQAA
jgi:hypothetical protein